MHCKNVVTAAGADASTGLAPSSVGNGGQLQTKKMQQCPLLVLSVLGFREDVGVSRLGLPLISKPECAYMLSLTARPCV